ncbi:MAG: hypothetical protein E6H80_12635 [Betaproteobacteria bacterium]|nr:MAG: hypothetical protein E6H80_12635 [Betaproteobacteria bacterium]
MDKRAVNRRVVEALVRAGAFDCLYANDHAQRASLLASVGIALEAAEQAERNAKQVSLFGAGEGGSQQKPALIAAPQWTGAQRLREEKASLGFYLSGHPFRASRLRRRAKAGCAPSSSPGSWSRYASRKPRPAAW